MATNAEALALLSDVALVAEVGRLAQSERSAAAALIASLVEFDRRRLYLPEGFPSLFAYCTQQLHLSEYAAYHRIEAARAARRFPVILELLESGALTLTAVGLLRPHLTEENHREMLDAARFAGKRAVEDLVARLHPQPDVRASIRKLPPTRALAAGQMAAVAHDDRPAASTVPAPLIAPCEVARVGGRAYVERAEAQPTAVGLLAGPACGGQSVTTASKPRPAIIRATAPERYQVQITVSAATHAKLRHAQDLLRHVVPNGDPAMIFDRALTLLVEDLERKKCAAQKDRPLKKASNGSSTRARARGVRTMQPANHDVGAGSARRQPAGPDTAGRADMPPAAAPAQQSPASADAHSGAGRSRTIPADVKRTVWARDGGRCAFVGTAGRCPERGFLEYHHETPFAAGGEATVGNISLRCVQHNGHEAARYFGPGLASRHAPGQLGPGPS